MSRWGDKGYATGCVSSSVYGVISTNVVNVWLNDGNIDCNEAAFRDKATCHPTDGLWGAPHATDLGDGKGKAFVAYCNCGDYAKDYYSGGLVTKVPSYGSKNPCSGFPASYTTTMSNCREGYAGPGNNILVGCVCMHLDDPPPYPIVSKNKKCEGSVHTYIPKTLE